MFGMNGVGGVIVAHIHRNKAFIHPIVTIKPSAARFARHKAAAVNINENGFSFLSVGFFDDVEDSPFAFVVAHILVHFDALVTSVQNYVEKTLGEIVPPLRSLRGDPVEFCKHTFRLAFDGDDRLVCRVFPRRRTRTLLPSHDFAARAAHKPFRVVHDLKIVPDDIRGFLAFAEMFRHDPAECF